MINNKMISLRSKILSRIYNLWFNEYMKIILKKLSIFYFPF